MTGRTTNADIVRTAFAAYLARATMRCPACGAEPGQPCRLIGMDGTANAGRELHVPHATRVQVTRARRGKW